MSRKPKSGVLQELYDELIGDDPKKQADYEEALVNVKAAQLLYDMRTAAGLSQRELAKRVGTTASVICRLEDADYSGHTLAMLNRIASALGRRIELHAVPKEAA
jgi:ribosome-binding protein aMBF1 (putative translation factor)